MAKEITTPIRGKDKILFFRLFKDSGSREAARLALQIEHEWKYERDNESRKTKDGAIVQGGGLEVSLEVNAISTRDELNKMLWESVKKGLKLEVWEVDLSSAVDSQANTYTALYAQGNLNEWTIPANVEELEEVSTTMMIDGQPVEGQVTLTEEEVKEVEAVYEFTDLKAKV